MGTRTCKFTEPKSVAVRGTISPSMSLEQGYLRSRLLPLLGSQTHVLYWKAKHQMMVFDLECTLIPADDVILEEKPCRVSYPNLCFSCTFFKKKKKKISSVTQLCPTLCDHIGCSMGFPCSSVSKESACSAGDPGLIPGLERSPGEGNGNPLQYPCLENLMDRGA